MKKLLTVLLCFMALFASMAPVYSDGEEDPPHEHNYVLTVESSEHIATTGDCHTLPTYYKSCECGANGSETFTGSNYIVSHNFVEVVDEQYKASDATHFEPAKYYKSCSVCHTKDSSTFSSGSSIPHTFNKANIDDIHLKNPATCKAPAEYYYSCECGTNGSATFTFGEKLDHNFVVIEEEQYKVSDATCTKPAVYKLVCSMCKEVSSQTVEHGSPLGHDFTKQDPSSKYLKSGATCGSAAVYYYACSRCGEVGTNTYTYGSAGSHNFGEWREHDESYHYHICSICGASETEKHKWNDGKVIEKPTETETGLKEYTCKVCGATKTEVLKRVNTRSIEFPEINIEEREYFYTGSPIEFEVPDSNYYTAKNNIQTEAGEYEVVISLNDKKYLWEDESNDDLTYKFIIQKADYDTSSIVIKDRAYIEDGKPHSLEAENLPDGLNLTFNYNNVVDAGEYDVVAGFDGDNNYNPIEGIPAKLYILKKPGFVNTLASGNTSVSGDLPDSLDLHFDRLNNIDTKYVDAKMCLLNNTKEKQEDILGIYDINVTYKGLDVACNEDVTVRIKKPVDQSFNLYQVSVDENGNQVCEKIKYQKEDNDYISFALSGLSQLVFVYKDITYLYVIVGIAILILLIILGKVLSKPLKKAKERRAQRAEEKAIEEAERLAQEEARKAEEEARRAEEETRKAEEEKNKEPKQEEKLVEVDISQEEVVPEVVEEEPEKVVETVEEVSIYNINEDASEDVVEEEIVEVEIPEEKVVEEVVEEVVVEEKKESFFKRLFKKKEKVVEKTAEERLQEIRESKSSSIYKLEDISEDDD